MNQKTEPAHPVVDTINLGAQIHVLHDHICIHGKRVEITRDGCDDRCIILSKKELDALEHAIQMFADTQAFADMSQNIQQLLKTAGVVYYPQALGEDHSQHAF